MQVKVGPCRVGAAPRLPRLDPGLSGYGVQVLGSERLNFPVLFSIPLRWWLHVNQSDVSASGHACQPGQCSFLLGRTVDVWSSGRIKNEDKYKILDTRPQPRRKADVASPHCPVRTSISSATDVCLPRPGQGSTGLQQGTVRSQGSIANSSMGRSCTSYNNLLLLTLLFTLRYVVSIFRNLHFVTEELSRPIGTPRHPVSAFRPLRQTRLDNTLAALLCMASEHELRAIGLPRPSCIPNLRRCCGRC